MAAETATLPKPAETKKKEPEHPRDLTREVFETLVFVVVLVLLLKLFVAEAFVIPTGSMAPSLWGDQVRCTCRECGHKFPINATITSDDQNNRRLELTSYLCENCGYHCTERNVQDDFARVFPWSNDRIFSGDRVLVAKYAYHLRDPKRFDVPVFKYPVEPYAPKEMQGMNYIKRLVGLGGETIAVFGGDLYVTRNLRYEHIPAQPPKEEDLWHYPINYRPSSDDEAWRFPFMYPNDPVAIETFQNSGFEIVRKTPDQILAMRRIVFDLDKQPRNIKGIRRTRWHPGPEDGSGWQMEPAGFRHEGSEPGWMRYQHLDPWRENDKVYFIVDHIGYNNRGDFFNEPFPELGIRDGVDQSGANLRFVAENNRWVSDLVLDCTIEVPSADSEVVLELNKGPMRLQAILTKGECQLVRYVTEGGQETRIPMGSHATKIKEKGTYAVKFANVDSRLTVWVDKKVIPFSAEQCEYPPPSPKLALQPTERDRLQPARVGAKGDVKVSRVSLWRDLHYNCAWNSQPDPRRRHPLEPLAVPSCTPPGADGKPIELQTYYVQPGHYLMFGDNTNSSKDGRSWGLVPHRLMLGRAVVVYWPLSRLGVIE